MLQPLQNIRLPPPCIYLLSICFQSLFHLTPYYAILSLFTFLMTSNCLWKYPSTHDYNLIKCHRLLFYRSHKTLSFQNPLCILITWTYIMFSVPMSAECSRLLFYALIVQFCIKKESNKQKHDHFRSECTTTFRSHSSQRLLNKKTVLLYIS